MSPHPKAGGLQDERDPSGRGPADPGSRADGTHMEVVLSDLWLPVPGYEEIYEASQGGSIRNSKTGQVLRPYLRGKYFCVTLHGDGRKISSVHILILLTFHGARPDGRVGAHLDGKIENNRSDNLRWVTPSENEKHKAQHGTNPRGVRASRSIFSNLQISIIKEISGSGISAEKIAALLEVNPDTIYNIIAGRSYGDKP